VSTTAINGALNENPFNFKPLGLTDLKITAGGDSFPREGLKLNFTTGDYEHAYINTLAAIGLDTGNRAITISPSDFASGYNLYAFKLAPGPLEHDCYQEPKKGECKANLSFSAGVTGTQLIVYAEIPGYVHITDTGVVSVV
jgi:hypothetical protein